MEDEMEDFLIGIDDLSDYIPTSPLAPSIIKSKSPSRKPLIKIQSSPLATKQNIQNIVRVSKHIKIEVEQEKENDWKVTRTSVIDGQIIKKKKVEIIEPVVVKEEEEMGTYEDWGSDIVMTQDDAVEEIKALDKRYLRCTVASIEEIISEITKRPEKILEVRIDGDPITKTVILRDDWCQVPIEISDTINLIGTFLFNSTPSMIVDRKESLLILHPDILISSTKVADSAACSRKALLQDIIRNNDIASPALLYGNMIHELLQTCLTQNRFDLEFREEKMEEILSSQLSQFWTMGLELHAARAEMREKTRDFGNFSDTFCGDEPEPDAYLCDPRSLEASDTQLALTTTLEVEEDIWSPKYGLRGMVDVSVLGKIAVNSEDVPERILPFEIKTGRTTAALEHRAQTMLYTLLMSDRYDEEIDSGLLYYSTSNTIIKVTAARNEIRSLIIARNDLATYLHRRMNLSETLLSLPSLRDISTQAVQAEIIDLEDLHLLLPAPIDDTRGCARCFLVDPCMLFRRSMEGDIKISEDEDDKLQIMFEKKTSHLTDTHAAFFKKWEKLIGLEEQEMVRFKKEIWTMSAEERANVGRCIANVSIDSTFVPPPPIPGARIHRFSYRLFSNSAPSASVPVSQKSSRGWIAGNLSVGDPVVISLETPSVLAISRGFVLEVHAFAIVVGVDRSLVNNARAKQQVPLLADSELVFRIDKDEMSTGMGRVRDNLIQLFVNGGDEKRRSLIVDLETPTFRAPTNTQALLVGSHLNSDQRGALEKVLAAEDYALILGMPGTGKTTTIAEILKVLVKAGKSILLTSFTHSAVDNILLKVMDSDLNILRLGNRDKIMTALHKYTLDPNNPPTSITELDNAYMTPQIVATTCLSINEPIFKKRRFDYCIVDEASQVTMPTVLGPIRFADAFILVGDHNQLPPLVRNVEARKGGLDVSLFKRLSEAHPESLVSLTQQYRMNDDIMYLSNKLVYKDQLTCGSKRIADRRLTLLQPDWIGEYRLGIGAHQNVESCWISELLDFQRAVTFVNTDLLPAPERRTGFLIDNDIEAQLVLQTTQALVQSGIRESEIGVIALYRQQIKLLSLYLNKYPDVEVITADKSQGRDFDCILISLTRSNQANQVGDLLKDWRRLNVCFTRAKAKLIIFGSRSTLESTLTGFFKVVDDRNWQLNLIS